MEGDVRLTKVTGFVWRTLELGVLSLGFKQLPGPPKLEEYGFKTVKRHNSTYFGGQGKVGAYVMCLS